MRDAPRVLIVEDEFLIASALKLLVEKEGASVLGPVGKVAAALELIRTSTQLDCALLDIRLESEPVFPVANALRNRGVRFAFISGYEHSSLPAEYRDATYFSKLVEPRLLLNWIFAR